MYRPQCKINFSGARKTAHILAGTLRHFSHIWKRRKKKLVVDVDLRFTRKLFITYFHFLRMVNEQVKREKNNQVEQQTREATSYCFSRFSSARLFCVSQEEKNLRIISSTSRKASTTTITALRLLFECGVYKTVIMMFLALWLIGHIHSAHMTRVWMGANSSTGKRTKMW